MLRHVYEQATTALQSNTMAELDVIMCEVNVNHSLEQLDLLLKQQPQLPDGSRCVLTRPKEAASMVAEASEPVKKQHKQALRAALQQVADKNTAMQQQYLEQVSELQVASAQIKTWTAQIQQISASCDEFRQACT